MLYEEFERSVLVLLNQFTLGGADIRKSYNLQADTLARFPSLANDAQVYLATYIKEIPESVELSALTSEVVGRKTLYAMPSDFLRFRKTSLYDTAENERVPIEGFIDNDKFFFSPKTDHAYIVEYARYPVLLDVHPKGTDLLDNTEEIQRLIPYYVAAHIAMSNSAYDYASLKNEFETMASRVSNPIYATYEQTEDVYSVDPIRY